jgi:hypothetical protein
LSGNVTAVLGTDGTLLIKGEAADNAITVSPSPSGAIRVQGDNTRVNGVSFIDFTASSVARITIQLGGGNDSASVSGISVPDRVTISDNWGNDTYNLSNLTLSTGSVNVSTGRGNDAVTLHNIIAGAVNASMGAGNDFFHADHVTAGNGAVDGGARTDTFQNGGGNSGFSTINFEHLV